MGTCCFCWKASCPGWRPVLVASFCVVLSLTRPSTRHVGVEQGAGDQGWRGEAAAHVLESSALLLDIFSPLAPPDLGGFARLDVLALPVRCVGGISFLLSQAVAVAPRARQRHASHGRAPRGWRADSAREREASGNACSPRPAFWLRAHSVFTPRFSSFPRGLQPPAPRPRGCDNSGSVCMALGLSPVVSLGRSLWGWD